MVALPRGAGAGGRTTAAMDAAFWLTAGAILALILFSAFFSGSETALTGASRGKLRSQADRGSRGAASALKVTEDPERMIGAILLGNNVVNILAASLATALLTQVFGDSGVALATLGMTVLVLVFGEVLPKTLAITYPEAVAARVAPVIRLLTFVFAPIVSIVRMLVRGVLRLFGVRTDPDTNILAVREEIVGALSLGHAEGIVEKEDRDRIIGALDLADRTVEEIMLHRSSIQMIDANLPVMEILDQVLDSPHSRLPLYRDEPENIVGILHSKDVLRGMRKLLNDDGPEAGVLADFNIMEVAREAYFIPETTALDDQMRQFLRQRRHFALVVDEYGALQGLITLEDIIEEIVGEIADEFDAAAETGVAQAADGSYLVAGTMTIRDLNRMHDWMLPDEEANTIAGLVIHEAQMIPVVGQVFSFHGFRFEVLEKDENRISALKIKPL
ncbi:MAG: HlyC/CorC family transporter [Rubellimicrobium sp.]|nr:HlyC/CorC family transporter [Rubellimicrobium sp.]